MTYETVRVWDPFVRIFHGSLLLTTFITLFTEDDVLNLHVYAGYGAGLLILTRIVWGVVGPRHARFSDFVRSPAAVIADLKGLMTRHSPRYLGHSPAGGAMIILLMVLVVLLVATGMASYGAEESAGPLAAYFAGSDRAMRSVLAEIHQGLANALWVAIILHMGGVIYTSLVHRENLVRAMITGMKRKL